MELEWPLMLFTTFIAWCAGLFGTQSILALNDKAQKSQMTAWIVAAVLLVIGGLAVFLHLQHWERIMNGFGHITSGITQELIAIIVLGIVAIVYLVCMRKSDSGASVPRGVAVIAICVCVLLVVVMCHSYMMASRPTWNTACWILAVLGEACVLGPSTMAIIMWARKDDVRQLDRIAFIGAVANLITALIYSLSIALAVSSFVDVGYHTDPTEPAAGLVLPNVIIGSQWPLLVLGVVIIGAVVPLCIILFVVHRAKLAAADAAEADSASTDASPATEAAEGAATKAAELPKADGAEANADAASAEGGASASEKAPAVSEDSIKPAVLVSEKAQSVDLSSPVVLASASLICALVGTMCLRVVFFNTGLSVYPFF